MMFATSHGKVPALSKTLTLCPSSIETIPASRVAAVVLALVAGSFAFLAGPTRAEASPLEVCQGPYALCSAAPCEPIPKQDADGRSVPPDTSTCDCVVAQGWNIAPATPEGCEGRASGVEEGLLVSTYSFGLTATHPTMACPAGAYTDCFGYPCIVDENDPTRATCTCPIVDSGLPFVTLGGGCDADRCTDTLWSAATVEAYTAASRQLAEASCEDPASCSNEPPSNWCADTVETATLENPCADYCYQVMGEPGVCVGEYAIYESHAACLDVCSQMPMDGVPDAVSGDSVQCRIEHAKLAQGPEGPKKHCPHAAPGGGGVCVNRSPCEAYCLFYYDRAGVAERECPRLVDLWGPSVGTIGEDNVFEPNPQCMETCAGFAESGQSWEMSGDSANCRMQYYLMAHRTDDPERRESLCSNAHPTESTLCQGSTFSDYYAIRETDPCRELCYNDWLSCGNAYGSESECLETCAGLPETGQRQATSGDSVYCRLTWAQYAFFVEGGQRELFCDFARIESPVCRNGSEVDAGAVLPAPVQRSLTHH